MKKRNALIVTAMFIPELSNVLKDSSIEELRNHDYDIHAVDVAGLWEVPFIINHELKKSSYDCVIVNGFIIGGSTTPYSNNMSLLVREKILQLSIDYDTPIGQAVIEAKDVEESKSILDRKGRDNEGLHAAKAMIRINNAH